MLKQLFQPLIAWYLGALKTGGYVLIALLMALEGSFLPLPSEFIIPPAAHLAWSGGGLNFFQFHLTGWPAQIGIVIAAAFGSWLGASAMYWLVRAAGRAPPLRCGKFVLFPPEKTGKGRAVDVALRRGGRVRCADAAWRAPARRHPDGHREIRLRKIFHVHGPRRDGLVLGALLRRRESRAG